MNTKENCKGCEGNCGTCPTSGHNYDKTNFRKNEIIIKVKYFNDRLPKLKRIKQGDWIDLYAAENIHLSSGEYKEIPLGVGMILPYGYEALMVARSSAFRRYGIIQSDGIGIIDNAYCGEEDEWKMPVYATRDSEIPAGERICQFRIIKNQPQFAIEEVAHLKDKSRGGFGSTGR